MAKHSKYAASAISARCLVPYSPSRPIHMLSMPVHLLRPGPLHTLVCVHAACTADASMCTLLLEYGADIKAAADGAGATPLILAAFQVGDIIANSLTQKHILTACVACLCTTLVVVPGAAAVQVCCGKKCHR